MADSKKTKQQLIRELADARKRIKRLDTASGDSAAGSEARLRYEFIVNSSRELLSLIDSTHTYVAVNDAYCNGLGMSRDQIAGQHVSRIWGEPVYKGMLKANLDAAFAGNEVDYTATFPFRSLGDRVMHVTYYPYRDANDQVTHVVVFSRDVTDQKASENELLALKKAIETMQLGVTISDVGGHIIYANPAEARMHGYERDTLIGRDVKIFGTPAGQMPRERTVESLNELRRWRRETYNTRLDGSVFPVQLWSDVVTNDGLPVGIVTTCEDISERKFSEQLIMRQFERIQTLQEISTLTLSNMDLPLVINTFLNYVTERLHVDAARAMLFDPATLTLECCGGRGFKGYGYRDGKIRVGHALTGRVALERRPLRVEDMDRDPDGALQREIINEGFTFYHGAPLLAHGHIKGVLEVFHRGTPNTDEEWEGFLNAMAHQAAIAIDNSSMLRDLQRSNLELSMAYDATLDGWSRFLDLKDRETEGHSRRVTEATVRVARAMSIAEQDLVHIKRGALLHDIGKMGIPDQILLKPGPLSEEEWAVMRLHPTYAFEMLSSISFLRPALDIPYCHHERWDGSGYPRRLKGRDIPMSARIFSVVDNWDALRSDRPYRSAWPTDRVAEHIKGLSEKHFDPEVVEVFLASMAEL